MTLGNKLKYLRKNKKVNQSTIADLLNISQQAYAKYEQDITEPDTKNLKILANYFNVTVDYLIGVTDIKSDIEQIKDWINNSKLSISELSQKSGLSRQYLYQILKDEIKSISTDTYRLLCNALSKPLYDNIETLKTNKNIIKIPIYSTIPAGVPTEMIDDSFIDDYEEIDSEMLRSGNKFFGLIVKGDSMAPEFRNGDILILKQTPTCESGDYCAVSINSTECTFKKVIKEQNGIVLQPLNPSYTPQFFNNEQIESMPITILGKVVEVRRSYEK